MRTSACCGRACSFPPASGCRACCEARDPRARPRPAPGVRGRLSVPDPAASSNEERITGLDRCSTANRLLMVPMLGAADLNQLLPGVVDLQGRVVDREPLGE